MQITVENPIESVISGRRSETDHQYHLNFAALRAQFAANEQQYQPLFLNMDSQQQQTMSTTVSGRENGKMGNGGRQNRQQHQLLQNALLQPHNFFQQYSGFCGSAASSINGLGAASFSGGYQLQPQQQQQLQQPQPQQLQAIAATPKPPSQQQSQICGLMSPNSASRGLSFYSIEMF